MFNLPHTIGTLIRDSRITVDIFPMSPEVNWFLFKKKHIAINKNIGFYQKRFAVCHELAHSILEHKIEDKVHEREADQYAMRELIPEDELVERITLYQRWVYELEKYFGVERSIIEKRIKEVFKLW